MTIQAINNYKNVLSTNPLAKELCSTKSSIKNYAKTFFKSPLMQIFLITTALIAFTAVGAHYNIDLSCLVETNIIGVGIIGLIAYKNKKILDHEISIYFRLLTAKLQKKLGIFEFNKITDGIYLGAMPLNNKGYFQKLLNLESKNKKLSILSMQEKWELERSVPFVSKVNEAQLGENNVTRLIIEGKDHELLTVEKIKQGIKFIQEQIKLGRKVYVHCKGGKGRSATVLACYLMVEKNLTPDQACAFIKDKRKTTLYKKHKILNEFYQTQVLSLRKEKLSWFKKLFW